MEVKMLEIRDRATYIPVVAIRFVGRNEWEAVTLQHAGFSPTNPLIYLIHLESGRGSYRPYDWTGGRTMQEAHVYIEQNWSDLVSGDVVDVEFILGENTVKKTSLW